MLTEKLLFKSAAPLNCWLARASPPPPSLYNTRGTEQRSNESWGEIWSRKGTVWVGLHHMPCSRRSSLILPRKEDFCQIALFSRYFERHPRIQISSFQAAIDWGTPYERSAPCLLTELSEQNFYLLTIHTCIFFLVTMQYFQSLDLCSCQHIQCRKLYRGSTKQITSIKYCPF
jgi:hypothetical protein